jgi:hypothetical protein
MRRIACLGALALLLALAPGSRAMDIVRREDSPDRAHLERAEREVQQQREREERMRRADELQREAKELMRRADDMPMGQAMQREAEELRAEAKRMMAEAEELRRDLSGRVGAGPSMVEVRGMAQGATPKTLVLPAEPMEPEEMAGVTEDLTVMSRILEKVLSSEFREGLEVLPGMPGGPFSRLLGEESMPSMYLQGYGALFFLRVDFPLAGPMAEPEHEPQREPDNLWDQTRREMHGPGGGFGAPMPGAGFGPAWEWRNPRGRFDPERVERLKRTILDTLRHAARIRALGRDESVTVVVFGAEAGGPVRAALGGRSAAAAAAAAAAARGNMGQPARPRVAIVSVPGGGGEGDVLIIRAAKKDIDALAEGKLNLDEFADRATIMIQ